jgi:DNA-binding winged helix-turn-helix (wHTH) protein/TolB-like protein
MAYTFGPFRYDAEQRLLFRGSEVVPLVPKVVDTLHVLLENRGRIVEKGELIRLVWPDTTVEESGLARNISILRKALDDQYIETIPRRGYRFQAEAQAQTPVVRPKRGAVWITCGLVLLAAAVYWQFYHASRYLPSSGQKASMAVVPFEGVTGDVSREFEEVLTAELSQLDSAQLISPSTVRRYQRVGISTAWMGRLLNLDVILEGAIQPLGESTRVTARLADVHSGKLIWAGNLEAPHGDFRATQKEVARIIAEQVAAKLRR